jgi:uncharacterized protein
MEGASFPSRRQLAAALDPERLCLLILPTEQCNFRCAYCYEEFAHGKMRPETVEGIKRLIDRRADDVAALQVSWFGGEPLIAKDIVFDITEHAARRCRERGVAPIPGAMTTNGYLLSVPTVERLAAANQTHYQISLDGLNAAHDRTRPLMSGKGTFERVWGNLTALRESACDFYVSLRVHFGACAPDDTEALCREVNRRFGGDERFTVYLKCIEDYGGANGGKIRPLEPSAAKEASVRYAALLPDVAVSHMYDKGSPEICYAAHPNNLMIRADGRVGKCALALTDPCNTIGHLDRDGRLHIDDERLQPWMRGFAELDERILRCPYQGVGEKKRGRKNLPHKAHS